ncbi:MAG: hypothetical protein H7A05_00125 [Pseudomonadales bacterium]|nr:hypothetical protein [Pseudomonadales bacterium]MCP5330090.1 hypothetical protein [Pseudomonadales bacterium]MCP5343000.1 hypothetical protein [Pseudomonadales bacterium]
MKKPVIAIILGLAYTLLSSALVHAQANAEVTGLQQRWAEVNYLLEGKSQVEAFNTLIDDAEKVTRSQSNSADAWIWSGIIRSSYAGAKGGLGALSAAKAAKADFEKAMSINADAMDGSAYTSLGVLYLNVPGWPVGFGDEDKGVELLKKGLELSPNGIDANYFYAEYLFKQKQDDDATRYLNRAMSAPARPGRELADQGRRAEIEQILQQIEARH